MLIPAARLPAPTVPQADPPPARGAWKAVIQIFLVTAWLAPHALGAEPPPAMADAAVPLAPGATSLRRGAPPASRSARPEARGREAALERLAPLETILSLALERNPELAQSSARAEAARALSRARARLPEPELEYQLWAAPLARPYALDQAEMHMLGVRQVLPAWGSLEARGLAAKEEAGALEQERRVRELELVARVRRAYAQYRLSSRESDLHREHAALAGQILEAARAAYRGGRSSQQEVVRATLEVSRLHRDVATVERAARSARGLLNTLMARAVDAPLGPPSPLEPVEIDIRFAELLQELSRRRPEMISLARAVRAREHELDAARASARYPTLMLGAQYMYLPFGSSPHNYGITLSVSLPWINSRYGDEARAAEASVAAERSAGASLQNALGFELYGALQRFDAAQESWRSADRTLIPLAEQSYLAAQAGYRSGQGDLRALFDALRELLDLRLERERIVAEWDSALAELERAAGVDLRAAEPSRMEGP